MISGLNGDGVDDLLAYLAERCRKARGSIPADEMTDAPLRLLAAEITREQIFLQLHQELPYASTVETEGWEEFADGSVKIAQLIHVAARQPEADHAGQGRQPYQEHRRSRAAPSWRSCSAAASIFSSRSG